MQHPHDQREEELYSIVLSILRDNNLNKNRYSFRDIHQNPKKRNNVLYGISSNPDLAVYDLKLTDDRNFNQKNFIYGVVEIKAIGTKLENKEKTQLLNEVVWFGRVLYTNGVHWVLYEYDNTQIENTPNIDLDSLKRKDFDIWLCNNKTIFSKKDIPILPQRFPRLSEKKYNELCQKLRDLNWKSKV